MDLLERYLQAVGQYLPAATKNDTLAELRANLLEQMDASAEERGRPLVESDVAAILKQHGKPELVALRYLPQRSLIGPTIFPFYRLTLRRAMPLVVLVYTIASAARLVFGPAESALSVGIVRAVAHLIPVLLWAWAAITIVFAGIEASLRTPGSAKKWNEWDPTKLPAVKAQAHGFSETKSLAKRIIDLALHALWMAYILWIPWHPFWMIGPGVFYFYSLSVTLAPAWHTFYLLLITLLTVQLAMKLLAFVAAAHAWMKPLKLATDAMGLVALGWMAFTATYFVPTSAAANLQKIAAVNHSLSIAFRIAVVVAAIGLVSEAWKSFNRATPAARFAISE